MRSSYMICVGLGLALFVLFPLGIPPLQSDWSLSCDHGLDIHSNIPRAPVSVCATGYFEIGAPTHATTAAVPHAVIRPHAYTVYGTL